jgi:hypothetical protein
MLKLFLFFICFSLSYSAMAQCQRLDELLQNSLLMDIQFGNIAVADIDNDGDQDLLVSGSNVDSSSSFSGITALYKNNGFGLFTEVMTSPLPNNILEFKFGDLDNDNDEDLMVVGGNASLVSSLYFNDGQGNYSLDTTPSIFTEVRKGSLDFADVDLDGDLDVLLCGEVYDISSSPSIYNTAKLYLNNGNGTFVENLNTTFAGVDYGVVVFVDADNDNDPDVLIGGNETSQLSTVKLYLNSNSGTFTLASGMPFDSTTIGSISVADLENDGDADILISYQNDTSKIYTNNGSAIFSELSNVNIGLYSIGLSSFADLNGDKKQEIIITGATGGSTVKTSIYGNQGNNGFQKIDSLLGVYGGSIGVVDLDNDMDNDIIIGGNVNNWGGISSSTRVYINNLKRGYDTVATCNTYTWIDGNTYTSSADSIYFVLDGGSLSGCDSVVTLNLSILEFSDSIVQSGFDLSAEENGVTYQWLDCNNGYAIIPNAVNQNYTAIQNGSYAVEISNALCIDTSSCIQVTGLGKEDLITESAVKVYPNPGNGFLNVELIDTAIDRLRIYNVLGQIIIEREGLDIGLHSISLKENVAGSYILELIEKEKRQYIKWINR